MRGAHVLIAGAGGNIGSHLVPHLGRMTGVARVTLVDGDSYEDSNLSSQELTPGQVGCAKAAVQATRLRRINPALQVVAHRSAVEALPLGALRADVILACVDSRASRQYLNESARRLGVPWIDAGVDAAGLLARVNVYAADEDGPCLECAWSDADYAALEQRYPCHGALTTSTTATAAPSALGGLAGALLAIECQKLLGRSPALAAGRQVLLDFMHHRQYVTSFRRRPSCLLASHSPWPIRRLRTGPRSLTVADALRLAGAGAWGESLAVAGRQVASRQVCTGCGRRRRGCRFVSVHHAASDRCAHCGGAMLVPGFDAAEALSLSIVGARDRRRSLASFGVRRQDVVIVSGASGRASYFEIGGERE